MAFIDDFSTDSVLSTANVPESFICPITHDVMRKPVLLLADGQTYEEEALKMWLAGHDMSPVTQVKLNSKSYQTNYALKDLIANYEAQRDDKKSSHSRSKLEQVSFNPERQTLYEFLLRNDCDEYFDRLIHEGFGTMADLHRANMVDFLAMDFGRGYAHRLREAIQKDRQKGSFPEFQIITPGKVPSSPSGTPLTVNVILLGDVAVGKTSIRKRLETGRFESTTPTQGFELTCLSTQHDGESVQITIWDPAGQERFASLTKSFFRRAHAAVVIFSADQERSWKSVEFWMKELHEFAPEGIEVILVCNKSDLVSDSLAFGGNLIANAMEVAREKRMPFFMTSAKSGDEVTNAFQELVSSIFANDELLERIVCERDGTARAQKRVRLSRDDESSQNQRRLRAGCCSRRLARG